MPECSGNIRAGLGVSSGVIFSLILEVAGAAGAIWGTAQIGGVIPLDADASTSRPIDITAGTLSLYCFIILLGNYYHGKAEEPVMTCQPLCRSRSLRSCALAARSALVVIAPLIVLEVLGGAGAMWGSSEILGVRDESNTALWKRVALATSVAALFKLLCSSLIHIPQTLRRNNLSARECFMLAVVAPHYAITKVEKCARIASILGVMIGLPLDFVLQVLGAGGAIWGASMVAGIRNMENNETVRLLSIVVGTAAFIRFIAKQVIRVPSKEKNGFWQALVAPVFSGSLFCRRDVAGDDAELGLAMLGRDHLGGSGPADS